MSSTAESSVERPFAVRCRRENRGFILILVVGMLSVLLVLGLSYVEQGRVELRGAGNTADYAVMDGMSEIGFQFALRALHDDQNVKRTGFTPGHLSMLGGAGWSTRWGYNPDPILGGALPSGEDRAPSRDNPYNYQDSWRMLFWNEETVEPVSSWKGTAWGYGFKFRPGNDDQAMRSMETQRFPQPSSVLLDTVQLQPFARVRKFRIQAGSGFSLIQIGITPKDGGVNLNDVFDPGSVAEKPGMYETLPAGSMEGSGTVAPVDIIRVPYASPDRRTLEYILGKPPEIVQKNKEPGKFYSFRQVSFRSSLVGSADADNGLYNWRHLFEPYGGRRAYDRASPGDALWVYNEPDAYGLGRRAATGIMTAATSGSPTTIWNVAGNDQPNRFGMEPSRYTMWTGLKGMSFTADGPYGYGGIGILVDPAHYGVNPLKDYLWFPAGLWKNDPRLPGINVSSGALGYHEADQMFQGFGFDRQNPYRAGIDSIAADIYYRNFYIGSGSYGHPKTRTFQLHFMNAVAQGRFWTDLLASWYFGGAPGFTNYLGATQASGYNNWAHLGSTYDSLGIGTHWMPPTSHVWLPGFFSKGQISNPSTYSTRGGGGISPLAGKDEVSRGMIRWPGNMPPARVAASYLIPMARWPADFVGQSNAQFTFNSFRLSLRAHGIQENWGDPLMPGTLNPDPEKNRWYDSIDVNNTNFNVVYGLLTPEKIPSLLCRTVVAPHLHWKARMLDVECRLKRPVKLDGSAEPYDDVKNSWMPVQVGLRTPDSAKTYPGRDWNGDPDNAGYNPWIPLRMKLDNPDKPWNPDSASADYNVWVEPKLLHPGTTYDPVTNPFYNSAAFLNELKNDANKRHDFIKYPWMPSLKVPVTVVGGADHIKYGMYGWNDAVERPNLIAQGANWSTYIQDTLGVEHFPYMPVDTYGAAPTWKGPGPFDGAVAYPSPGWDGYLFEPRWYTGRTVNPKYLKDKRDGGKLADLSAYYAKPGRDAGGGANTLHASEEPANVYAFSPNTNLEGGVGALTGHRHVDPDRPNVIWGKMDFLTPEPEEYYDLNGDLAGYGTGCPADDVFMDSHPDLSLVSIAQNDDYRNMAHNSAMVRPDNSRNWYAWFRQRKELIPADPAKTDKTTIVSDMPYRPSTDDVGGRLRISNRTPDGVWVSSIFFEGKTYDFEPFPTPPRRIVRAATSYVKRNSPRTIDIPEPDVKPHTRYGLPNPDYLQHSPGGPVSQNWIDQFRRYMPIQLTAINTPGDPYRDPDNNPDTMSNNPYPGAMPNRAKMVDDPSLTSPPNQQTAISPCIPVPRAQAGDDTTPVVPAVSKDEAWRITRIGPRYQEIIANEMMDYQLNPWWPNPCVPVSELCVPLDKKTYPSETRAKVKVESLLGRNRWRSYTEHMVGNEATIGMRVPKYYVYFNRFWTRTNHKAVRNWTGDPNDKKRPLGEPYRAITIMGNSVMGIPDELINADEGKGIFPPTWQYFGQYPPSETTFQDRIKDFPYNALEDQLGDDWRYLAQSVAVMTEPQMQLAPGRNHPFRNWADFVAFLGHLVYRSLLSPKEREPDNTKINYDLLDGVDAYTVCHGVNADPRNQGTFFDGSKIRSGAGGTVYADSLRGPIVAKEGFWPISANYGRAPDAGSDPYYPKVPLTGGWNENEWRRRWDEIRGRDEAGLRVEHHYISESSANDVLVSFSNGKIGPIDFDGNGHVEMTRGDGSAIIGNDIYTGAAEMANAKPVGDLPQQRMYDPVEWGYMWRPWSLVPGYPWNRLAGDDPTVEFENPEVQNPSFWDTDANPRTMSPLNLRLGIKGKVNATSWKTVPRKQIIESCVTLPIKFHSNTFRVTVVVELTDSKYEDVYATRRYQKVFSRVPSQSSGREMGAYSGEFIEHSSRSVSGADPELNWLGVK